MATGHRPKVSPEQDPHTMALHGAGDHTIAALIELFGVGRAPVYRALERHTVAVNGSVAPPRVEKGRRN